MDFGCFFFLFLVVWMENGWKGRGTEAACALLPSLNTSLTHPHGSSNYQLVNLITSYGAITAPAYCPA